MLNLQSCDRTRDNRTYNELSRQVHGYLLQRLRKEEAGKALETDRKDELVFVSGPHANLVELTPAEVVALPDDCYVEVL